MSSAETLYLIDGAGFIFRAYFAIRAPMSAADGTPTNAVFGFTALLMSVLRQREPTHVAVVFDPSGPTFRNEMYAEYKANRSAPPEDLRPQFSLCREAVDALGIPALVVPGYEADDVIGTLATQWLASGETHRVVIITADKDMMQLVNDLISIWDGKEKESDRDAVIEKFGVPPEAVADALGLAGDSSDNIPGVPGIGLKTAATLLQEHGTMEALLAAAGGIKGKRGENLREFAEQALLSKRLATIALDAPIALDAEAIKRTPPDPDALSAFLRRLNFKTFLREFGLQDHVADKDQIDRASYRTILTYGEFEQALADIRAAGRFCIDLETTSLSPHDAEVVGFALAWAPGKAVYVPVAHVYADAPLQLDRDRVRDGLAPLLTDPDFPKLGQNSKYEWQVLGQSLGIRLQGVVCDTMLAAYLLDPGRRQFNLDELSRDLLGHKMISFREVTGTKGTEAHFAGVDVKTATTYAAEDADVTLRLADLLQPKLVEEGLDKLAREVELPLVEVIGQMELWGVRIDADRLRAQSARYVERIARLAAEIHALAGGEFNIDSPKQLGEVLFEKLNLPAGKKTQTGYSTDAQVLNDLVGAHPLPGKVLDYRHLTKLKSTYLDTLPTLIHPKTGRLHSSFRQAVAATGRISSSDPNLQNIPVRTAEGREIREAFIAEDGFVLLSADYSQIELRLLAHYSGDPGLISSFADGADIHRRTAAEVFGVAESAVTDEQRRQAKSVNFGLMYGMSAFRLSNELHIPQALARDIIRRYFKRYAGVKRYFDQAVDDARRTQKTTTLLGRMRHLPNINTRNFNLRQQSERLAVNTPIQGTAADILKLAMLAVDRRMRREALKSRMILTVHDELVFEVPTAEIETMKALVRAEMEGALPLAVPLVVDMGVGANWAEIH
ncbi:MAG: DNA polymerase I [Myxococcales bacterium]|nr:DNA polymerase I [Myxococcales bacterium]